MLVCRCLFRATRTATRVFRCPLRERAVSVEFVESVTGHRRFVVKRCSLFVPATAVDCPKPCLKLRRRSG